MRNQLKKLLLSSLALLIAQSSLAAQPGKYYSAKDNVNLQCNIKAKRASAKHDLYENGAVIVFDAGTLTLTLSPAFPSVHFIVNNQIGYGDYKYIDEGSIFSGELKAQLQKNDDVILLTGHAYFADDGLNTKTNCQIAMRFERKA